MAIDYQRKPIIGTAGNTLPPLTLKERVGAERMRRSLYDFAKGAWHVVEPSTPFVPGWHLEAICEHLEAVTRGDIRNLLVNMPPRHAKSLMISTFWPMWVWCTQPQYKWLCASYALSLSVRDNRKCRILIESDWYRQRWGDVFYLSHDQNMKMRFENSARGYRLAISTESAATGEGGDSIICLRHNTPITTDAGPIPIGEIVEKKLPVRVFAYDHTTNTGSYQDIEKYESSAGRQSVRVTFSDGRFIDATTDHPFYIIGRGYVPAAQLVLNEYLFVEPGSAATTVQSVEPRATPARVYNLRIAHDHNYFANGILLHNCDDPHNVRDARSETKRNDTLLWWSGTMQSRLNDQKTGHKVVVMQRVGVDDLSGFILEQGGFELLRLPAEFDPEHKCVTSIGWEDPRTVAGELLWPVQVPQHELDGLKKMMGAQQFSAQFQQNPVPDSGSVFKAEWLRYFSEDAQFYTMRTSYGEKKIVKAACWKFATVDLAASLKTTADYTVISTWAVTPDNSLLLLDVQRDRMEGPDIQKAIVASYHRFNHRFVQVESVAFQMTMTQGCLRLGVPVQEYRPQKDKVSRAISASIFYSNEQVFHRQFADYLTEFEPELLGFPNLAHDDQVDTLSAACEVLFAPNQANIRTLDDDADTGATLVAAMERGTDFWGDF